MNKGRVFSVSPNSDIRCLPDIDHIANILDFPRVRFITVMALYPPLLTVDFPQVWTISSPVLYKSLYYLAFYYL